MGVGALAAISAGASMIGKAVDYGFQRSLYNQQTNYPELMRKMTAAGISPAAAAQGISGSVGNSVPSFSGSGAMDLSSLISAKSQALEAENNASRIDVENQYDKMKMLYEPSVWFSQIEEAYSRIEKNASESAYFGSLKEYYNESKEALKELRPWNLNQAILNCQNLLATYDEINSRTAKNYSEKLNLDQQGFVTMWENSLRAAGFNPNDSFFENVLRLASSDPKKFKQVMEDFQHTLVYLDNSLKEQFGRISRPVMGYILGGKTRSWRNGGSSGGNTLTNVLKLLKYLK